MVATACPIASAASVVFLPSGTTLRLDQPFDNLTVDDIAFMLHRQVKFCGSLQVAARPSLARHTLLLASIARTFYPTNQYALSFAYFRHFREALTGSSVESNLPTATTIESRILDRFEIPTDHRPGALGTRFQTLERIGEHAHLCVYHSKSQAILDSLYPLDIRTLSRKVVADGAKLAAIPEQTVLTIAASALTSHILSIRGLP